MRWFCLFILFTPFVSSAAVTINEVAWMGGEDSANHEWIELYNDGNAVDVSGWTLTDGMNLSITLEGTIPAGDYAVLERTSEDSSPGSAFLIYTGALVNGGATLQLRRADGSLEDQVSGGENWEQIGGDNVTKETAQYTTSGWVTAVPTPGQPNTTESEAEDEFENNDTTTTTKTTASKKTANKPIELELPGNMLRIAIDAPDQVYVNQKVVFSADAEGVGKTIHNSLSYNWNYGDGEVAAGKEQSHYFQFPGTYVVALHAAYKRQEAVGKHEITVLPVTLSVTRDQAGNVQINNDAKYEIDVSGYKIVGTHERIFADNSFLAPRQTVTLRGETVGRNASIYDNAGVIIYTESAETHQNPLGEVSMRPVVTYTESIPVETSTPTESDVIQLTESSESAETPEVIRIIDEDKRKPANETIPRWQVAALLSLIILGIGGVVYRKE